ncbi:MAG: gliding motility-associated C-terminal domain-containing protein [Flavobacteriales bacterium]|nr:gliding motility-associated C-terminal domain-containing protein [Flavobacteriales bacterium]
MFLSIDATDKQLNLSWSVDVPWNNNRYVIFKMHPDSTTFDSIGQVATNRFTDTSLTNGRLYCYYIKSVGDYNLSSVISPIVNLSQEACASPIDNVSPCSPSFNLTANCDNGELRLRWNNIASCASDVSGYRVYRSDISNSELILIKEINDPNDTTYAAPQDSVGGCFTISSFDDSGNESILQERICTEYCPIYELPNVFTPNGDGINDLFTPVKPYRYVDSIQLYIYNRWGEQVFQSNDPAINWSGKHQKIQIKPAREFFNYKNELASGGVYYYVCEVYEQSLEPLKPRIIKGTLTILDPKSIQEKQ